MDANSISIKKLPLKEARQKRVEAFALYVAAFPCFNIDILHKFYINIFQQDIAQRLKNNQSEVLNNIFSHRIAYKSFEIRKLPVLIFCNLY